MRDGHFNFLLPALTAAGLVFFAVVFAMELGSFRRTVVGWARRDLEMRTELAAASLREALATGDFRRIHAFGETCRGQNLRLTVFSSPGGGLVFDSVRPSEASPEYLYETRPSGECAVRLGLPIDNVLAPFRRARLGFLLAGLTGGACVLLVLLFTYRQHARLQALARLEKFRRDFIADVSHEIKTPLTGILGSVDLLMDDPPADARRKLLGMVKNESMRLNDLAQNVLALAGLERENFALECGRVDAAELVRETLARFKSRAAAAGIALRADVPPGLEIVCDSRLVTRALANLVENAIRYSGARDVAVVVRRGAGENTLTVEDHGRGIAAEHAARVFERFYRVDSARSAETGGAGLGLAIVRSIARLHGGDATLEPAEPTGCRFTVHLPLAAKKGASVAAG